MKNLSKFVKNNFQSYLPIVLAAIAVGLVMLYRLGSLVHPLSYDELQALKVNLGLHGIYHNPLYLPIKVVQSLLFVIVGHHGQIIDRLPNTFFGVLSILIFAAIAYIWHGRRTAILSTVLFATAAWTLHVSRLATYDVLYLWAMLSIILAEVALNKWPDSKKIFIVACFTWGLLLTIPGMIWFVLLGLFLQRDTLLEKTKGLVLRQRLIGLVLLVIWLPLLIYRVNQAGHWRLWLGLPNHFVGPTHILKNILAVPVHLYVRGPEYPALWLAKTPLMDAFALVLSLVGLYFYATHWKNVRSQLIGGLLIIGTILIGLSGPVSLSLLVGLVYLLAATGLAYFIHEWLRVFPHNPLARSFGIGLLSLAVILSCAYNLRLYFVAWPNDSVTKSAFHYDL